MNTLEEATEHGILIRPKVRSLTAMQFDGSNAEALESFLGADVSCDWPLEPSQTPLTVSVLSNYCWVDVYPTDWVLYAARHHYVFVLSDDQFSKLYEPVHEVDLIKTGPFGPTVAGLGI